MTWNYDDVNSGYHFRKGNATGETIHSPYTLVSGEKIYCGSVKSSNVINGVTYSGEDLENKTLKFVGTDINIVGSSGPQYALLSGYTFVIEYSDK